MSKVVLIKPKNCYGDFPHLPLGLLHLGTFLQENGYQVKIIDAVKETSYQEMITKECQGVLCCGIGALSSEVSHAIEIADFIKEHFNIPVVFGGWHATLFPEQTCKDRSVDYVVSQEGEYTFLELLKAIKNNGPFDGIKGLTYKDEDGGLHSNSKRDFLDMNELPRTNYDLVDMDFYLRASDGKLDYQSSRGCPYRCKFCINVVTGNNLKYRFRAAQKVIEDVKYLVQKFNLKFISFVDDNFFLNRERVKQIGEGFISNQLNIRWFGECRANYFRKGFVDYDLLETLENSGLTDMTIGAESGSPKMLKKMDKQITVDDIVRSAEYLSNFKHIVPGYSFIIGLLGETKKDIILTLKLIKKLKKICPQMQFAIGTLRAYPNSPLSDEIVKAGYFKAPQDLRDWLNKDFSRKYLGIEKQPWHFDSFFIYNVARFSNLAYNTWSNEFIKKKLLTFNVWYWPEIFFIFLARLRFFFFFFSFSIDLKLRAGLVLIYKFFGRFIKGWQISSFVV